MSDFFWKPSEICGAVSIYVSHFLNFAPINSLAPISFQLKTDFQLHTLLFKNLI